LFIVGGLAISWFLVDRAVSSPGFKTRLETAASDYLQRPLTITELEWQSWPRWVLVGNEVTLWEASDRQKPLIDAPHVEAHLTLLSFYKLAVGVSELTIVNPRLFLRKDSEGQWNVSRMVDDIQRHGSPSAGPQRKRGKIIFNQLRIKGGSFALQNMAVEIAGQTKLVSGSSTFSGIAKSSTTDIEFQVDLKTSPVLETSIHLRNARYLSESVQDVHAVVRYSSGVYTLERTHFAALGGSVTVSGLYRPAASTDSLKMSWTTTGVQAERLFRLMGSDFDASGVLDCDGNIGSGVGALFLPSLNGDVKINLKEGWFGNATGLLKVLTKLNLTTLITEAKGEHKSRVPFNETRGVLKITNGVVNTVEPFVLENKTLQMAFMGTYALTDKTIDGQIAVHVLLVTDEILHKIPLVRDILLGDEKGLLPIWLSVQGNAADPKIRVMSVKSIAGPVWNTIANTLRLPEKMFEKLTGK
jgi:uncharacterized protein involved in outer membrane biogenesis